MSVTLWASLEAHFLDSIAVIFGGWNSLLKVEEVIDLQNRTFAEVLRGDGSARASSRGLASPAAVRGRPEA
ncbi:hypothetical protein QJS10_CPB11g00732 [Acorus calamus]|uniref:Uncharacterized protein n=1 Tax=Acorus calamus TaxID=4465 RepID=A0AAV9DVY4_ACOCL|nr:hypothetical protein QJS10_CPB11g00732 [Acorus calamus]